MSALERLTGISRQTGRRWLNQFGLMYGAYFLHSLPPLCTGVEETQLLAAVPQAPAAQAPGTIPSRKQLAELWRLLLALVAGRHKQIPDTVLSMHVFVRLQPELARLWPPAGVFRVQLHEQPRAGPWSC